MYEVRYWDALPAEPMLHLVTDQFATFHVLDSRRLELHVLGIADNEPVELQGTLGIMVIGK